MNKQVLTEGERQLWGKLCKNGQILSLRFDSTTKHPRGMVLGLGQNKYIIRAQEDRLVIEPYW